jgi:FSR family fosmidomycin resistance protein-like MFS transporter
MSSVPPDGVSSRPSTFNLKILLLLSFGHLVTDIYQGALPAILPFLKDKLALTYTMAGVLLMASNFTSSILQPIFGHFSDKKEKALLLPLGCLAAGLGLSLASLTGSFWFLLVLVVVSGLGIAAYHPEGYKTASYFTGEHAATGMSVFSVGGNLGIALGPLFSLGVITYFGFKGLPLMLVFSLSFLVLLFFEWGFLRRTKPLSIHKKHPAASGAAPGAYLALFLVIATVVMRAWIRLGLMTYIPFYFIQHLKGDPLYSGKLVTVFLLGGVVGTIFGSMLADRWGHKEYLVYSLVASSLLSPLVLMAPGPWLFVVLFLVGTALISSFTVTIVMAQRLLPHRLGVASGLMVGFAIGTGGFGVTLLGIVADHFGVAAALKTILFLPLVGLVFALLIRYPFHGPVKPQPADLGGSE